MIVAGIMSGTSLDGIDVALVEVRGRGKFQTLALSTSPYPAEVRRALLAMSNAVTHTADIARMHFLLPELYAAAVQRTARRAGVVPELAGCHGQTIFHEGDPVSYLGARRRIASTLQIGDGAILAARLCIPVVSDFRPSDIAAGGKGAPLVPFVDYLLFASRTRTRVALNIGGIANITAIPASATPDRVAAFDTGPGNMVIDQLVARHTGGRQTYDRGGRIAATGTAREPLLRDLLRDPFYRRKPPKTAGREQYGAEFIERLIASGHPMPDLIATATALTAHSVALAVRPFEPHDLIVSGGGAHNSVIIGHLRELLPRTAVAVSSEYGIDPDGKEAIAFALLADETWRGKPANLPSATGARRPAILGKLSRP